MVEWVSYVGASILAPYIELAFGLGIGLTIVLGMTMPFRSRVAYKRHSD